MKRTLLAVSIQFAIGSLYAAETEASADVVADQAANRDNVSSATSSQAAPVANVAQATEDVKINKDETKSLAPKPGTQAAEALQKKEGDASQETNLQEVFTSNERQYSLIKKGEFSTFYDLDYAYYRDSQLNLGINEGTAYQLRVDEDASHTISNTFTAQYGIRDNLTFTASIPFIAKSDSLKDATAAGLGDINFGARWEPFPLKAGRLPLILFGSLSTKTGDSPYEINPEKDLFSG